MFLKKKRKKEIEHPQHEVTTLSCTLTPCSFKLMKGMQNAVHYV